MYWHNKVAIVTGGASGIGKEICSQLIKKGAIVYSVDINETFKISDQHYPHQFSVTDTDRMIALVETIINKHKQIDLLFNNAGIGHAGETTEITKEEWDHSIDVNLKGIIHGINAVYPIMKRQGFGQIINTSSIAGLIPVPLLAPYTATKHAIVGLSGALRMEAKASGIKVNVLCPGVTDTGLLDSSDRVNIRRFFSNWTKVPYTTEEVVTDALTQIKKDIGVIVVPKRMKRLWSVSKLFPSIVEKICLKAVNSERSLE